MLRRKAYDHLMEWKSRRHKCLLVTGQRQVGKTYIIEEFGKRNYPHLVIIDLMKEKELRNVFEGDLDVESVIRGISVYRPDARFVPGSTLILFDEIQECPRARTALKYFTIDGRFDVIATGSLLGVTLNGVDGGDAPVPVGYEEDLRMYSLDFEEFLWARGYTDEVIAEIRQCISDRRPLGAAILERTWALFKEYMTVGGMPEAVQAFLDTCSYAEAGSVLDSVIAQSRSDIARYNPPSDRIKIVACYDSMPSQLSQTNKKFMYSRIDGQAPRRSRECYGSALEWVIGAGYANPCWKVSSPQLPLMFKRIPDCFRMYVSDTGILLRMCGQSSVVAVHEDDLSFNMGAVAENVVAECLMKCGLPHYYYAKSNGDNRMELDFVIESGPDVMVIEVKSGKSREYPSLRKAMALFDIGRKVVLERADISVDDEGVEHYPLFAAAFMDSMIGPPPGFLVGRPAGD